MSSPENHSPAFEISSDPSRLDIDRIHRFLSEESYWARGISHDRVRRSIAGSLCFGAYGGDGAQLGFARVISDRATFAYLCDVFVVAGQRGKGIGKALVEAVFAHPDLIGLRRYLLATWDAHELYRGFGFASLGNPQHFMERVDPDAYTRAAAAPR